MSLIRDGLLTLIYIADTTRYWNAKEPSMKKLCQQKIGGHANYGHAKPGTTSTKTPTFTRSARVKYLSSTPLTEAQGHLLACGPNLAIVPKCQHNGDYMVVVEQACSKLDKGGTDEPMVEVKSVLKTAQPPRPNINREEKKVMKELRNDDTRVILTTDKGVAMVVMGKHNYIKKAEDLLNQPT